MFVQKCICQNLIRKTKTTQRISSRRNWLQRYGQDQRREKGRRGLSGDHEAPGTHQPAPAALMPPPLAFLETNSKTSEREIKGTIPFTIATKRIKYLGVNQSKEAKTCTLKTIRYWWKKSKLTQTDGEIHHVLGLEESIFKNNCTTQNNLQIQCNSYQITSGVFHRIRAKNCTVCTEMLPILKPPLPTTASPSHEVGVRGRSLSLAPFWSSTSASHWQNLQGSHVARDPGKCSLQPASPSSTEQGKEGQVWNWDHRWKTQKTKPTQLYY